MVFANILDPVFNPVLALPPFLAMFVLSLFITALTTLAYKYLTDQKKMKAIRAEMKEYQKKIKKLSKENPQKAMEVQKEMMGKNMEMMKHSFKPMIYTLIPLLIIYGWLGANLAYHPLQPDTPFEVEVFFEKYTEGNVSFSSVPALMLHKDSVVTQEIRDDNAKWVMRGEQGEYTLRFGVGESFITKDIIISEKAGDYTNPEERYKQEPFHMVMISNDKIHPFAGAPLIGGFGWLGAYITLSILFSFGLRKLFKVA